MGTGALLESVYSVECKGIEMVEAGGVGVFSVLKTRKLLILLDAQNSRNAEIALNWNVSGTRDFHFLSHSS